ncbi:MAG: UvrD-helicase domain-containing protein [Isosphaeraceae bacterium]|nr:UvrD-helicase domain-containing protein [Isosphaeraceae bacterium]
MDRPRFTEQQRRAVETRTASVALNAGAGCGKTYVLAHRLLAEIAPPGGRPLSRVAALTFTNKAARELRDRVRAYCRAAARSETDPSRSSAWRGVVRELEAAPISTFHVFCGKILERFGIEAGIDPASSLLEGTLGLLERRRALEDLVRDLLRAGDNDAIFLGIEFGLDFVISALADMIADAGFDDVAAVTPRASTAIFDHWRKLWSEEVQRPALARLADSSAELLARFESIGLDDLPKMRARVDRLGELVPRFLADPSVEAYAQINEQVSIAHVRSFDEARKQACKQAVEAFRAVREDSLADVEIDPNDSHAAAAVVERLIRLAERARASARDRRRARSRLDFNDLLLETRDLLRARPETVRQRLAEELDLILIDEFQDTDPIQEEIVRRLVGDDPGGGGLFLVGDVKQSIYGFRGARPDLFSRLEREFPPEGRLPLSENFRSLPGVLDFVNTLFADAFGGEHEPLSAARPLPRELAGEPTVIFLWDDPAQPDAERSLVSERRRAEAGRIARLIADLIASERPVRDRKTNEIRPVRQGDFALLFRSLGDLAAYERALSERGLDYHVIGGRAFYAQQEIVDITNAVSCVEDPYHSISLAGFLRGPMVGLSDEALFWIAQAGGGNLARGFHRAIDLDRSELADDDREKAVRARALLETWSSIRDRGSIEALVKSVLETSGFECAILGESLGDRMRANARKLLGLAREFDAAGGLSTADFAARLREDLRNPPKEAEAATTDEEGNVVRLLSIHQSKGLEFPVVVVPDLGREEPRERSAIALDPVVGLVVRREPAGDDPTEGDGGSSRNLGRVVHDRLQERRERAEAERIFYVATTRARDLLILSSADPIEKPAKSAAMSLLVQRFDLATGEPLVETPPGERRAQVEVVRSSDVPEHARPRRRGPDAAAVAARIERLRPRLAPDSPPPPTPRWIDLDAAASSRYGRVANVVRALLADPAVWDPDSFETALSRAIALEPARLAHAEIERVRSSLASILGDRRFRAAAVAGSLTTSVPFQRRGTDGGTYVGIIDLLARDASGRWSLCSIGVDDGSSHHHEWRLRLLRKVARDLGYAPIESCSTLLVGEEPRLLELEGREPDGD